MSVTVAETVTTIFTPAAISAVSTLKKDVATPLVFVVRGEAGKKIGVTPVALADPASTTDAPENAEPPVLVTVKVSNVCSKEPVSESAILVDAGEMLMAAVVEEEGEEGMFSPFVPGQPEIKIIVRNNVPKSNAWAA
tara:strand:+ start:4988 stop:5398 length:411 start_codon:yes stop_codon:yes gene_type:complete